MNGLTGFGNIESRIWPLLDFERIDLESRRLSIQQLLDAERSAKQRNETGQFATPPQLAEDVMRFALSLHGRREVRFLEPSCGSGAFFSALLEQNQNVELAEAVGVELDHRFATAARDLWGEAGLKVVEGDFLAVSGQLGHGFNLLVANPPYVRHHHLDRSQKLAGQRRIQKELNLKVSGLSGLYVYFMLLSHQLLAPGAVSAWLIPSEFLDTNYGRAIRQYLVEKVTLNRIHRFDPEEMQFSDALVTSSVVVFTNECPIGDHKVAFSRGGTVCEPQQVRYYSQQSLDFSRKWGPLFFDHGNRERGTFPRFDEFFKIRRGIATGNNDFFILPRERIEALGIRRENVTPIMPAPRYVRQEIVESSLEGYPMLDHQLAVLQPSANSVGELRESDPALADYLGQADEKILNAYLVKSRRVWFKIERRDPAPILLTYMGRGSVKSNKPFRFILNKSQAIATNMYLMLYPIGALADAIELNQISIESVFETLLSISAEELLDGGRVYGGGLRKIEPGELASMDARAIAHMIPGYRLAEPDPQLF